MARSASFRARLPVGPPTVTPAEVQICGDKGSAFLTDDRFRVWEFREPLASDQATRDELGIRSDAGVAGGADPKAIDFTWHQRNFENVAEAIQIGGLPAVDGHEGRRSVALIEAIYRSAKAGGEAMSPA